MRSSKPTARGARSDAIGAASSDETAGRITRRRHAGRAPGDIVLRGRYGHLEKLREDYAEALWSVFKAHDAVWTYVSTDGRFASFDEFAPFITNRAAASDPHAYAIVDIAGGALGYLTLMEIRPQKRVIEVGHVLYSPALQRTPRGTEAQFLLARYAFETLGYRRLRMECNALNAASRRAASATASSSKACCART